MEQRILVCYATGSGSTGEVAEFIGKELARDGVGVDVRPVSDVADLNVYSAVVLGSSVRFGRWLPEAITFLQEFTDVLHERPSAFFTTCLTIIDGTESTLKTAQAYWDPVLQFAPQVEPIGLGLFAGSLAPELAQLPEYGHGPIGDYRDWDAIRTWVHDIRPALLTGKPHASVPMVLAGTILSYTDMSGYDLSKFDFRGSEFVEARLRGTKLEQANLHRSNLALADLSGADFHQAQLGWADLHNAKCKGADFTEANLLGAHLENADLQNASLADAILNGANLSQANLQQTNLQDADLNWTNLQGCDLTGANLAKSNLGWANLSDADLSGANFEGARYNAQTKWPNGFSPAQAGAVLIDHQFV